MPDCRQPKAVARTALKALGLAAGVVALVVGVGFLLASRQVRGSAFGKSMERRFPIRWSEVALVFGSEKERVGAAYDLAESGSPRALGALERATRDRAPGVRWAAVGAIRCIGLQYARAAVPVLLRVCRTGSRDVRMQAYSPMTLTRRTGILDLRPALDDVILFGLNDPDCECRGVAALWATQRLSVGPAMGQAPRPQLAHGLERCLRGPSPPWARGPASALAVYLQGPGGGRQSSRRTHLRAPPRRVGRVVVEYEGNTDPRVRTGNGGRVAALYWLWLEGTEGSRKLVCEELAKRPLTVGPDE